MTVASVKAANTAGTWNGNVYTLNNTTFEILTDESGVNVHGIKLNTGSGGASGNIWEFVVGSYAAIANTNYTLNGSPENMSESTAFLQTTASIYGSGDNHSDIGSGVTYSTTEDKTIYVRLVVKSGYTANNLLFYPMIRLASVSDATFEPYENICPISGRTGTSVSTRNEDNTETASATISFGTTVYGGQVDFKTGRVTITWAIVDMGSLTWEANPDNFRTIELYKKPGFKNMICSIYKTVDATEMASSDKCIRGSEVNNGVIVKDTSYSDAASFKTAMSGVQLCYELATPTELTLTPAELMMLKGYNYITGDGVITITAYAINEEVGA